jgi:hypothetical protein
VQQIVQIRHDRRILAGQTGFGHPDPQYRNSSMNIYMGDGKKEW